MYIMTEDTLASPSRWRATLIASGALFVALLALFWPTVQGMVHVWYNFETYTHGFLILPISLWLIWQHRHYLAPYTPQPTAGFLLLVGGALIVWAVARLSGVLVVEQLAFVAVAISAIAGVLGSQVARYLAFPLLFLFFAVPMGEDLIPPMMEFTATFTVEALRLTGIPVYRDGLWFSLPTGNWSVVEACSGVRYLIASVTLGVMYAYITYHTLWKRLAFIALSALVPILANGMRAYMIVMIGHLSDMKYATGVDHLVYGWVFFGFVMFILFWIGSRWREDPAPPETVAPLSALSHASVGRRVILVATAAFVLSAGVVWATYRAAEVDRQVVRPLAAPDTAGEWRLSEQAVDWTPEHLPTPHTIAARYAAGPRDARLFVVLFPLQRQGAEAINQDNQVAAGLVRRTDLGTQEVALGDERITVRRYRAVIETPAGVGEHLVWQWYRIAGTSLSNRYLGKLYEAAARFWPGRTDGAWIALTTPYDEQHAPAAEETLAQFANAIAPRIDAAIDRTVGAG